MPSFARLRIEPEMTIRAPICRAISSGDAWLKVGDKLEDRSINWNSGLDESSMVTDDACLRPRVTGASLLSSTARNG